MLDMKELTKCHYQVLIRNKELIEENEKLRKEMPTYTIKDSEKMKYLILSVHMMNFKYF